MEEENMHPLTCIIELCFLMWTVDFSRIKWLMGGLRVDSENGWIEELWDSIPGILEKQIVFLENIFQCLKVVIKSLLSVLQNKYKRISWVWWCMPIIPALGGRLRQEDCEFEASLGCKDRPCHKRKKKEKKKKKQSQGLLIL
jgi:hypothetical protein